MERDIQIKEIAKLFLKLGFIGFGGPAVHIAMMQQEVVVKKKWMSEQHFLDLLGATNLIPGPNSTEMAIHIGYDKGGWKGLIFAGLCFILPAVFITGIFAWLYQQYGTTFRGHMTQVGELAIPFESWEHVPHNPFFAPVADVSRFEEYMEQLRKSGDSCGAALRVQASGMPVGLGEPLYDKLDAEIAYVMMGLNAVKGVEIGAGFASVAQRGTEHGDSLSPEGFRSNNAGGVLGGISTGQDLEVRIGIKPTSSIITPRESIDVHGQSTEVITKGRHDPCVGIRAAPIAEALLAMVLMDHALRHRAQNSDVQLDVGPIAAEAPQS